MSFRDKERATQSGAGDGSMSTSSSNYLTESSTGETREVKFKLALNDLAEFRVYQALHSKFAARGLPARVGLPGVVCLILVSICSAWTAVPRLGWVQGVCVALVVVLVGMALFALLFYMSRLATKRISDQVTRDLLRRQYDHGELDRQLGWQRLKLTSGELVLETDFSTSVTPWSGVEKIVTTESHAFFYCNPQGAHVLPMQAFGSEAEFTAFVEAARAFKDAGRRPGAAKVGPEATPGGEVSRQSGGVVEVAYKLTLEDSLALFRVFSMHELSPTTVLSWRGRVLLSVLLIGLAILMGVEASVLWKDRFVLGPMSALMLLVIGFFLSGLLFIGLILWFPLNPLTIHLMKKFRAKHQHSYEAVHRLRLTPDNLIQTAGDQVTARRWETVEKIVMTADHAFFRVSRTEVLTLPKRAFSKEAEFLEFMDTAKNYHQSARGS
jgi:hypothetical protein